MNIFKKYWNACVALSEGIDKTANKVKNAVNSTKLNVQKARFNADEERGVLNMGKTTLSFKDFANYNEQKFQNVFSELVNNDKLKVKVKYSESKSTISKYIYDVTFTPWRYADRAIGNYELILDFDPVGVGHNISASFNNPSNSVYIWIQTEQEGEIYKSTALDIDFQKLLYKHMNAIYLREHFKKYFLDKLKFDYSYILRTIENSYKSLDFFLFSIFKDLDKIHEEATDLVDYEFDMYSNIEAAYPNSPNNETIINYNMQIRGNHLVYKAPIYMKKTGKVKNYLIDLDFGVKEPNIVKSPELFKYEMIKFTITSESGKTSKTIELPLIEITYYAAFLSPLYEEFVSFISKDK